MTLLFTGDIMFQPNVVRAARQKDGVYSFDGWFDYVAPQVSAADFAIGNLECPIYPPSKSVSARTRFAAPAEVAPILKATGFDVLSLANNHAMDQGRVGLANTLSELSKAGITAAGAYNSPEDYRSMKILEKDGVKAALFCYANLSNRGYGRAGEYGVFSASKADFKADVRAAREKGCDISIFFVHAGTEYTHKVDGNQKNIAKRIRDAGGDIFIGHHPHVIQPIESFPADKTHERDFLAVWSLGNLTMSDWGIQTLSIMLDVTLRQDPGGPTVVEGYTFTPTMCLTYRAARGYSVRAQSLDEAMAANEAGDIFYKPLGKYLKLCRTAAVKILAEEHWKKAVADR